VLLIYDASLTRINLLPV